MSRALSRLRRDTRGAAAIEFALIVPVFLTFTTGAFDLAYQLYVHSVLEGTVQKTARDSSLESGTVAGTQERLDEKLRRAVRNIAPTADPTITRRFYRTFGDAAAQKAEPFPGGNDTNHNGKCDNGEVFVDVNHNGVRDMDGGDGGQGTARDRTVYTVSATVPRLFPVWRFIGGSNTFNVSATTVLANQPYSDQSQYGAPIDGHCP